MLWGLATTTPYGEPIAVENLVRQGVAHYSPKFLEMKIRNGRKIETPAQLFPGYLFVEITERWRSLFGTRGIATVMMNAEKPCPVRESEIENLRRREVEGLVVLDSLPLSKLNFREGDKVYTKDGAFDGQLGIYSKSSKKDRCKVLFTFLGRETEVEIQKSNLVHA